MLTDRPKGPENWLGKKNHDRSMRLAAAGGEKEMPGRRIGSVNTTRLIVVYDARSAFLRQNFRPSLASLLFRCLLDTRCNSPHVPGGVLNPANSVAPELGLDRHHKSATAV